MRITGVSAVSISAALSLAAALFATGLVSACGSDPRPRRAANGRALQGGAWQGGAGVHSLESNASFLVTLDWLEQSIAARRLVVLQRMDHGENATRHGLQLEPTVVVFVGQPGVGTSLIGAAPTLALDLPPRILVLERGGRVSVHYDDVNELAERHGLDGNDSRIVRLAAALEAMATDSARGLRGAPQPPSAPDEVPGADATQEAGQASSQDSSAAAGRDAAPRPRRGSRREAVVRGGTTGSRTLPRRVDPVQHPEHREIQLRPGD